MDALLRRARLADVEPILQLFRGGAPEGKERAEAAPREAYQAAFHAIDANPAQLLVVAELEGSIAGTYQLTEIQHLSYGGGRSALLQAVHVRADLRGRGLGERLVRHAVEEARRRGCVRLQLTSNKARTAAHRFYLRLGFEQSDEGFKLAL